MGSAVVHGQDSEGEGIRGGRAPLDSLGLNRMEQGGAANATVGTGADTDAARRGVTLKTIYRAVNGIALSVLSCLGGRAAYTILTKPHGGEFCPRGHGFVTHENAIECEDAAYSRSWVSGLTTLGFGCIFGLTSGLASVTAGVAGLESGVGLGTNLWREVQCKKYIEEVSNHVHNDESPQGQCRALTPDFFAAAQGNEGPIGSKIPEGIPAREQDPSQGPQ